MKWVSFWKRFGFCLIVSLFFLLLATKSSPLYVMNDWVDAQAFFTMGKGMVRGVVPYLDLFEQKGPLLYLIYGIGSLISSQTFIGIFLIEVLFFSIFLSYSFKSLNLYLKEKTCYVLIPLFALLILPLRSFTHGGSAEELCFPFLMISFYHLLRFIKEDDLQISKKTILLNGIIAGAILWIKYTLLGFWAAWILGIFLFLLSKKRWKEAFSDGFLFLGGMVLASVPWLIYFGIQHGLKELIEVYFTFNMKFYASDLSIIQKLGRTFQLIVANFSYYLRFTVLILLPIALGMIFPIFTKHKERTLLLLGSTIFLALGIYIGGTNYRYYSLILAPLMILGMIGSGMGIEKIKWNWLESYWFIPVGVVTIGSLFLLYQQSPNTDMLSWKKEDYAQYVFADYIKQKKDQSLLNYGFLDGGFYTTTGQIPKQYFFMRNNISYRVYPKLMDEQKRYVREQQTNFVVVKQPTSIDTEIVKQYYQEIMRKKQTFQGKKIEYILYEKKLLNKERD